MFSQVIITKYVWTGQSEKIEEKLYSYFGIYVFSKE